MRALLLALSLSFATSLVACHSALPQVVVHDENADRQALLQADRAFAKATADRGVEGWLSFFADDGAQLAAKKGVVQGKENIRLLMTPLLTDASSRLEWQPTRAEVSGDMGWTIGRARLLHRDADGAWRIAGRMQYLTVWRRQKDGSWRVILDIGNEDAP
jgi:ketosteroid isomerase-like protein